MKLPAVFRPLRHSIFARYMAGEFISMVGTWMQVFAQGWVVTTLTPSAVVLGQLNFTSGLPTLALTLIGGRFADRYEKRNILLIALAVQCVAALAIGYLIHHQQIQIWHLFVAAGVVGVASAFELPAVAAFVPELVPKAEMAGAIAMDRSLFHATRLMGPLLGGWLIGKVGGAIAYFCNALSFVALAVALFTIPKRIRPSDAAPNEPLDPTVEPATQQSAISEIAQGLRYVRGDVPTLTMVATMAALTGFVAPFLIISMPVYARYALNLDAKKMGMLYAISGIGSFAGSLGLLSIPHGRRSMALKIAATSIVASLCGLAIARTVGTAIVPLTFLTAGMSITFGTANIVIQERAPDAMRGRVASVAALSYLGVVPFSGLIVTGAIDWLGVRTALCCGAVCYAVATILLLGGKERLAGAPPSEAAHL